MDLVLKNAIAYIQTSLIPMATMPKELTLVVIMSVRETLLQNAVAALKVPQIVMTD